jgi:hypothetical protein
VVQPPEQPTPPADPAKAVHRSLHVGINTYPGCPLQGCVPDAQHMRDYVVAERNLIPPANAVLLLDNQATKKAMWKALKVLIKDAKAGDRRLFTFSGHGAEYAGDTEGQPDNMNQVICPYDFDWSRDRMIMDTDFVELFKQLPDGVLFNWLSDSCHSGDLTRAAGLHGPSPKPHTSRLYPLKAPPKVQRNLDLVHHARWRTKGFVHGLLDVGYISGCKFNQTSADTMEEGEACGACTYWFLCAIRAKPNDTIDNLAKQMREFLKADGFEQEPQAEGARHDRPFLQ